MSYDIANGDVELGVKEKERYIDNRLISGQSTFVSLEELRI